MGVIASTEKTTTAGQCVMSSLCCLGLTFSKTMVNDMKTTGLANDCVDSLKIKYALKAQDL